MLKKFFFFSVIILFTSCKETEDTIVNIMVRNVDGVSVEDATVRLFSEPEDSIIEVEEESNAAGEAVFDLSTFYSDGQVGLFVLSVEVEKDSLSTNSIIQVVPEEVNELTVILQ